MTDTGLREAVRDLRDQFEGRWQDADRRLRRIEFVVVALVVATASPKVSGPSVPQILTGAINVLGTAYGAIATLATTVVAVAIAIAVRN